MSFPSSQALKAPELVEASAAAWALGRLLDVNPAAVPDESQAPLPSTGKLQWFGLVIEGPH